MRNNVIFLQVVVILLFCVSPLVSAEDKSFEKTLHIMKQRFEDVEDYQCIYQVYTARDGESRDQTFAYYFKKKKCIRMTLLTGRCSGSVLIYHEGKHKEKVRVRAGNPLMLMMQKLFLGEYLNLDSRWVTDLRGNGVHESDWGWFIEEHQRLLSFGSGSYGGEIMVDGRLALYYELISSDPDKTLSVKKEELWVDVESYFPVRYIQYGKQGEIVRKALFRDLRFNSGIRDKWFELEQVIED